MKFYFYSGIVLICAMVQFFVNVFDLSVYFAIYPYILMFFLGFLGLAMSFGKTYSMKNEMVVFALFLGCLLAIYYYQTNILEENFFYILYSFRFYFGGVFMIVCMQYAYRTCENDMKRLWGLFVGFIGLVIMINFGLSMMEVIYVKFLNGVAPWTPPERLDEDMGYVETFSSSYRAYGFADNSAVLGGLSVFLTLYYISQRVHQMRKIDWLVVISGLLTVGLSQSGTGFFMGAFATLAVCIYSMRQGKYQLPFLVMAVFLIGLVLFGGAQFGENGRYSIDTIFNIWNKHGVNVVEFYKYAMDGEVMRMFFGAFNFQKFALQDIGYDEVASGTSLFDFAYVALLVECGFVGLFAYLGFYYYATMKAFRGEWLAKVAVVLFLLSSLHYGVSFWICSQVLSGAILGFHMHLKRMMDPKFLAEESKA